MPSPVFCQLREPQNFHASSIQYNTPPDLPASAVSNDIRHPSRPSFIFLYSASALTNLPSTTRHRKKQAASSSLSRNTRLVTSKSLLYLLRRYCRSPIIGRQSRETQGSTSTARLVIMGRTPSLNSSINCCIASNPLPPPGLPVRNEIIFQKRSPSNPSASRRIPDTSEPAAWPLSNQLPFDDALQFAALLWSENDDGVLRSD